ncbi:hypothetical protein FT663_00480 [Candidozyma haemuli var. vulneris]|uniref:Amino acid permease/ SLC12A domain-containing protein n=1 Tax=Candidozyma haemuli TaxID=45357 RepID=A0A2V1ARV3_9ASCO|nr:hypothetical protein CXQ85_002255 [[Candida] haemuloni]KAF3993457.1 hypothetical protein FT662_00586 [[Candida] haemuloni var. vulneris]KAF3995427.1 hypothetical protein FT663_00480 [[Candida] haemuloni var. vulneris]PVH20464.1 hypothetical protein CXQ85_002255 [[Candida] haemuloni]
MSESSPLLSHQNTSSLPGIPAATVETTNNDTRNVKKAKLGTFEGVFLPTTLNVLSILMFLRFGFIIGQMGILGTILLLVMSFVIDILTVLSVSAISTNGTVRGGGAYYMISRSLGPEFGGAIGIIFFIGQILNSSLNVVGFIEPLLVNFGKLEGDVYPLLPVSYWWQLLYSSILLLMCTSVALVGASLVSKTAFWLFVLLTTSTLSIPISALVVKPGFPLSPPDEGLWYSGVSWKTIQENLWPHFTSGAAGSLLPPGEPETFKNLFGIFFPATAGIFAGASMSGELKNPSRSIPRGTLYALGISFVLYFLVIVSLGASVPRELFHRDIKIMQTVNMNGLIIIIGEVSTSLFSVIMGVVGASTVLNAIAVDKIIPGLSCFSTARKSPKEKKRAQVYAIMLTWSIAQMFLFADINQIATFITMAFLMTFLVTNLACFLLRVGSAPNFRPSFKYFSSKTAFAGGLVSVLAMYLVDGVSATSVIVFLIFLIMIIHYTTPPSNFGDISQLLIYHQVRKYLLRLKLNMSVKYWRPQILLLCDNPRTSWNLITFCNHLKKGGLYILGHVVMMSDDSGANNDEVNSEFNVSSFKEIRKQKNAWTKLRDMAKIKAFVQIAIGPSLPWGVRNVFLGSGLGGMRPNITVLGFYDSQKHGVELPLKQEERSLSQLHLPTDECRKERKVSVNQWVQIVEDLIIMQATVAVAGNFSRLELPTLKGRKWFKRSKQGDEKKYIDLYPIQMSSICLMDDGKSVMSTNFDTYTLILQLGSILSTVDEWDLNGYTLRIIVFVESANEVEEELSRLKDLLSSLRIDAETVVKCFEDGFLQTYNFLVKGYSVTPATQSEFNHINHILHGDQWWKNLRDARESLRQIQKQKLQRKSNDKKSKSIHISDERKYDPVSFNLTNNNNSPVTGPSLKNNRRYTLSNLHGQGLSLSFNMKAQGGDSFFSYESEDSSDSDLEESMHSSSGNNTSQQRTPEIHTPEPQTLEASPTEQLSVKDIPTTTTAASQQRLPQKDNINKARHALLAKYKTSAGAVSSDQLSVRSSMSNLRPNFSSVKIPQSKVRDEEEEEEPSVPADDEGDDEDNNKPSIRFVEDEEGSKDPTKESRQPGHGTRTPISRNESFLNFSAGNTRPAMKRVPSVIAHNDINEHIKSPKFLSEADDELADESLDLLEETGSEGQKSERKLTSRQLQDELKNLTFNDLPAKGQHIILNELMRKISGDGSTAVIFSTLPAPIIGTHLDDDASLDYTNSLAIWLDNLPPTLLLNSQTVTVTTNL